MAQGGTEGLRYGTAPSPERGLSSQDFLPQPLIKALIARKNAGPLNEVKTGLGLMF